MNALSAMLLATQWTCSSPLDLMSGQDIGNAILFDLDLQDAGTISARGSEQIGPLLFGFTWTGQWIVHNEQLVMIGTKQFDREARAASEMRGYSVVLQDTVMILNLSDADPSVTTIRCLPDENA